jgi:hypothetical protein
MKSREEFVKTWKFHITGLSLFGYVSESRDGQMERLKRVHEMPVESEKLLASMYDWLTGAKNGKDSKPA